jgi:hypothetical protein
MGGSVLVLEQHAVSLGAVDLRPGWRVNAEFDLGTVDSQDVHGDVIADGDDFAYGAA